LSKPGTRELHRLGKLDQVIAGRDERYAARAAPLQAVVGIAATGIDGRGCRPGFVGALFGQRVLGHLARVVAVVARARGQDTEACQHQGYGQLPHHQSSSDSWRLLSGQRPAGGSVNQMAGAEYCASQACDTLNEAGLASSASLWAQGDRDESDPRR
jgi:hypothetical protein